MVESPLVSIREMAARRMRAKEGIAAAAMQISWERMQRICRLVGQIAGQPEWGQIRFDRAAAEIAALYVMPAPPDHPGKLTVSEVMVDAMRSDASQCNVPTATIDAATLAMRRVYLPPPRLPEADILAEAINLEDIAPLNVWRDTLAQNLPDAEAKAWIANWKKRTEYGYWDARIRDQLKCEWSRSTARRWLAAAHVFVEAIEDQMAL